MKVFLKILLWLFLALCLITPISCLVSHCFEQPISAILSALWGFPCGVISTKLVL